MKRLLITRSRHDIGNQYLYAYSEEILEEAKERGWAISQAEDEKNNPKQVQSFLSKNAPNLVVFNGHGTERAVCGHKDETLVDTSSARLLDKTVVFARACSAVSELGKTAIENGCKAFIGYRGNFTIPRISEYESTPLRDPAARPVIEVSNVIPTNLLDGAAVQYAVKAARQKGAKLLLKMLTSEEPYDKAVFKAAFDNHVNLDFIGQHDAAAN